MYTIITENDESHWNDDTGVLYHFPKRYLKYLKTGTRVIYYKGTLREKKHSSKRLSDFPHYFGTAEIGKVYSDRESSKGDLFAEINNYQQFESPVLAKNASGYLELIPDNKKYNYWRDAVRSIDKDTYDEIMGYVTYVETPNLDESSPDEELNDIDSGLESSSEGEKKGRFVTVYERDPDLRRQAVDIHGTTCFACGFNFGAFYGDYAEGYIHIHHIIPVSEFGGSKKVDPDTDLIPLCANCHSVIHRKKANTLQVSALIQMIENASIKRNYKR